MTLIILLKALKISNNLGVKEINGMVQPVGATCVNPHINNSSQYGILIIYFTLFLHL